MKTAWRGSHPSSTSFGCLAEGRKFTPVLSKCEGGDCIHIDLSAHHQQGTSVRNTRHVQPLQNHSSQFDFRQKETLYGFGRISKNAQTVENQSCYIQDQGELHGTQAKRPNLSLNM